MKEDQVVPEFSLFGGPLQWLGRRVGLVRGTNTIGLGIALGVLTWGIMVGLALLKGIGPKFFSLSVIGGHVRLLVVILLFFVCETFVAPLMAEFVRNIVRSGVVPQAELPALASDIRRIDRLKDFWLVEILLLIIVFISPLFETMANLPGMTTNWASLVNESGGRMNWVLGWYLGFCLPVFRFLLFRWYWHLALWWYFLWRVNRLKLNLIPTHPDLAGGLGYLEVVQEHFAAFAMAASATLSASFAEEIVSGTRAFDSLYSLIPIVLLLIAVLFIGPLFTFSRKLWACRITGLNEYMVMAHRYVGAFDRKWVRDETASGESQLGTADLQSLADLSNSIDVVRNMRWVPMSRRLVAELAIAALIPMLPLLLLKYPVTELATQLFKTLSGL
ncbi:MAG: hypothetical protein GX455_04300 [Phycisphaerae bacterium]|nr:hypothetical protein [Phycisphaerae bacterium]